MLKKFIRLKQPTQFMKIISDISVEFVINVSLKNVFKKTYWKSSWDWRNIQKCKNLCCNKNYSLKGESKHYTLNELIKFNQHPSV